MDTVDWDDPGVEEQWCNQRREETTVYLHKEGLVHGEIGSWPAWHVAPYISIWAVESLKTPGAVGWWVISGDLPTDYISASSAKHPRQALRAFAETWEDVASHMRDGTPHPSISIGPPEMSSELLPNLEKRSEILRRFADDDAMWDNDGRFIDQSS
ncbi:protein of unknown function [Granulicella pectinivorans]|uniref:DUF4826 domain-containing protein n=1 Tax=Granulicella pectinivorans TaxID=474950 RepID=A0A1I6LCA4_9BACT|nr:DUF4826 family protein [Granulicella pectinivorans]SFS01069.1 protein of unknown function [Granulicella pectinivorans]